MPDTETFSLKLSGTGLSVDQKVSKELATQVMLLIFGEGKTEPRITGSGLPGTNGGAKTTSARLNSISMREFLNQHEAKKIPQQIVAIGFYRETSTGKDHFTRDELFSGFRDAKIPPPANPSRDIARTVESGWIAPSGSEKDQYYVTGTGQSAVESNFVKNAVRGHANGRRGKRAKRSAKKAAKTATK